MDYRGLTLLVFGGSLILSPLAIRLANEANTQDTGPRHVQTEGALNAACDAASVTTPLGRMGCIRDAAQASSRRVVAGGAAFVSVRATP